MLCRILPQQIGHIQRGDLPAQALQGGEAHHNGRHLVLVQQHHPVGKGPVVADAAVPPEELVQSLGDLPDDQAVFQVGDPQVGPPETLRHPVHHHGHRQIVDHPAVAQKAPEIPGLGNEPQQHPENTQPAEIVIHRIPQPPPFPPPPDLPGGVQAAQRFASNSFAHFHVLPETSCDLFRIPVKRLYNNPEKMQGRRCVPGRPGRLRILTYTSLTYTYLTLPNLTSVAGSTPAWLTLGCHAVVKWLGSCYAYVPGQLA